MTEDHRLSNSEHTIDIGNRSVLVFLRVANDVMLLDVVQGLLFTVKPKIIFF